MAALSFWCAMSDEMIETPQAEPPVPSYNLARIGRLREALDLAVLDFIGTKIEGEQFAALVEKVHETLPKGVPLLTVHNSLLTLVGEELTKGEAGRTAWRLAANSGKLRNGLVVPPWTMQTEKEWVPLQILEVLPGKNFRDEKGFFIHQRVLAGSSCPLRIMQFWTRKYASWMSGNFGFTRPWKRKGEVFVYRNGTELTNMRLMGLMDPALTRDGKPGYKRFVCTSGLLVWNRQVLRARAHTDPPCPEGFTHACHQCPFGYDQCFAGCHPATWEWAECPECKRESWCDPGHPRRICVDCQESGR